MHSLFLSNGSVNEPLQIPQQGPMERAALLQGHFYISLKFLMKVPLNKKFIPSLKGPRKASLWKQTSISRSLLSIFSGSPVKDPPPLGSPHRAPSDRAVPFLEPFFIHLSTWPVYEPPSRFSSGAPMEMPFSSVFSTLSSRVPSNEVSPTGSPHRANSETLHP